ncbi:ABC transporter permease [Blastococcus sp. PRF04-17]|uniref:ABC transporter permease n=1 Tax=Blastococcus sp. PRF04-17 TaxID=2933797 RepID=UPI001FF6C574|nr:ABC transporter permease [Blastococcus sp. PRF04-17]UOY00677.1 hypothetical protein MVA48_17025 [Blastococcus sp. PRF04-17]
MLSPPERAVPAPPADPGPRPGRLAAWVVRWRLALRLARRDARRAKGRTALVGLMVGLPVLAIVGGDVLFRSQDVTGDEFVASRLGPADALIQGHARERVWADPLYGELLQPPEEPGAPWTAEEVADRLPAGSSVVERQVGKILFRTDIGYATVEGYAEDLTGTSRADAYEVAEGRVPERDGEVAISRDMADRGIEVGDTLALTREDVPGTVVGVLEAPGLDGLHFVVVPPGEADLLVSPRTEFFAEVPGGLDWPAVQDLNGQGLVVLSGLVAQDPPPASEYQPPSWPAEAGRSNAEVAVAALIAAALLLEVVLLAGPAFAVGLRKQRRDLALLAANGGTAADLRRAVLASGLLLGGGAAVTGALVGIGVARGAIPVLENRTGATFGPFQVPVLDVLVVVAVGALAGLAAAYMPARQAARTDVVTTLSGRRGQVRTSWHLPVLGLIVAGAGLLLTVVGARGTGLPVAGGAVLLIAGVVLTTPWLVGLLAPLARRLPVPARLAVRDATRNRSRTAPAVAAVMATVAGVTTLAIGSASDSAQSERDYLPQAPMGAASISVFDADEAGWADVAAEVRGLLPGRDLVPVRTVRWTADDMTGLLVRADGCAGPMPECSWYPGAPGLLTMVGDIVVLDGEAVLAVTPPEHRDAVEAAYRPDRVLVFGSGAVDDSGMVTLQGTRWDEGSGTEELLGDVTLPATEIVPASPGTILRAPATVVVPPALADRLPVEMVTSRLLVGGPGAPVSEAEEQRLQEAITALSAESYVYVERGWSDELWVARLLLFAVGGLLVLVATLTATGLAVADARPDHATLAAVGAAPRTRRLMAMGSAAVIGVFGAALGVVAGLAPGIAVAHPLTTEVYGSGMGAVVVVPWDLLAAVAIGVPLLAVLVTGLVVRSRLPMARRVE